MFKRCIVIPLLFVLVPLYAQEKKENPADPLKDLLIVDQVKAAPVQVQAGFESISQEDAEAYLRFIASDLLEGRDTGEPGFAVAGEFAAALFASWGLKPAGDYETARPPRGFFGPQPGMKAKPPRRTFFQAVPLKERTGQKNAVSFIESKGGTQQTIRPIENIDYSMQSMKSIDLNAPIVFIGYGIDVPTAQYNDYKGVDVKGKVVMIIEGQPENSKDSGRLREIEKALQGDASPMRRRTLSNQFKAVQKAGALAVISVLPDSSSWLNTLKPLPKESDDQPIFDRKGRSISLALDEGMSMPWEIVPRLRVSPQLADRLLQPYGQTIAGLKKKIDMELRPHSFSLDSTRAEMASTIEFKPLICRNVLAYIEGADPELKKEVVVIGGHLDHLGKSGPYIFNGADDNGSGAVVVLQTAMAVALNPVKPKRSMLFALWTGEEKGLLGSRYYVAHPFIPMKDTKVYLNIDMASRRWGQKALGFMARMMKVENTEALLEKIDVQRFATFSHFENPELAAALKDSNESVGLNLFLRPTRNSMGGSDHAPFGNARVPWVFFGGAMTEDYHQPSDEVERCSFEQMQSFSRICYLTAMKMAGI